MNDIKRPDLSGAKMISLDLETYDPNLNLGPGVYRRDGNILGVSLAVEGFAEYYSLAHKDTPIDEREANKRYLTETLGCSAPKVGANIRYDIDWLENWAGIKVGGEWNDIQIAEPLLDEYAGSYSLDTLSKKYLGRGKAKNPLEAWCQERGLKGDFREHMYLMPYDLVRPYGVDDAVEPLQVLEKQMIALEEQNLVPLYRMEMKLIKVLLLMRKNGIRVDREKRNANISVIHRDIMRMDQEFMQSYGGVNINSSRQLATLFDSQGIPYLNTAKGNPSMGKEFLEKLDHPLAKQILALRDAKKTVDTFLNGAFVTFDVNGRIHCEFIPMKQDDGGTVTGRLSARNPNLQQVTSPDRDKARAQPYGLMCREIFIPEQDCWYGKIDYSQIEYRVIAHFASGPGAEDIRHQYQQDAHTDFHSMAQKWALDLAHTALSRSRAKNLGFGSAYFMGIKAMMAHFGWSREEAELLTRVYFTAFPFMEPTRNNVVEVGKLRGYVKTPLGRRARVTADMRENRKEYIIFNHLIQGTAADILKQGMVNAFDAGLFGDVERLGDDLLFPHITVHDELGLSIPKTKGGVETYKELKNVMEQSIKLKVPIIADAEIGPDWGHTEEADFNKMLEEVG